MAARLRPRASTATCDSLELAREPTFTKCLRKCRTPDDELALRRLGMGSSETVLLSCMVTKVRDYDGKAQQRVMAITNLAVYNLRPGKYKTFRRRMLIDRVDAMLLSQDDRESFVIHFDRHAESDYTYRSLHRDQASRHSRHVGWGAQ